MSEERKQDAILSAVSGGAATFFAALATGVGTSAAGVAAGVSVVGQALAALGMDSIARRGETFASTFRRLLHESHEGDFDAEVRERVKDPAFRNVTYHALRQVRDAIDDAVVPALAVLTKDYTVPVLRPIDGFFRGAGDFLRDLSATEYGDLVTLSDSIAAVDDGTTSHFTLALSAQVPGKVAVDGGESQGGQPTIVETIDSVGSVRELAMSLRRNGLARDRPDTWDGVFVRSERNTNGVNWSVIALVDFESWRRLHSVLQRARDRSE